MQQVNEFTFSASARGQVVIAPNPTRLYLTLSVPTGAAVSVCTNPTVANATGTKGMALSSTVPSFLSRDNVGIAVTLAWLVSSNTGTVLVYCLEVFDPDKPFGIDDSGSGLLELPKFATDPHVLAPGIDSPDQLTQLISELKRYSQGNRR